MNIELNSELLLKTMLYNSLNDQACVHDRTYTAWGQDCHLLLFEVDELTTHVELVTRCAETDRMNHTRSELIKMDCIDNPFDKWFIIRDRLIRILAEHSIDWTDTNFLMDVEDYRSCYNDLLSAISQSWGSNFKTSLTTLNENTIVKLMKHPKDVINETTFIKGYVFHENRMLMEFTFYDGDFSNVDITNMVLFNLANECDSIVEFV